MNVHDEIQRKLNQIEIQKSVMIAHYGEALQPRLTTRKYTRYQLFTNKKSRAS